MLTSLHEFQEHLDTIAPDADDFPLQADRLISDVSPALAPQLYEPILYYFARHPDSDCGGITSFIHHIEHFYPNYTALLQETVLLSPSWSGIVLINRILNSQISPEERSRYLDVFKAVIASPHTTQTVFELASRYTARHAL